jgi:aspartate/methionine/tyrosine aminotransferase
MRRPILPETAEKLPYEIREIVAVAEEIQALGKEITWENIGDPVAKGEVTPEWVKEIVKTAAGEDLSYAYSPTEGVLATRQFLAERHNEASPSQLLVDNILFFNGLGDAISNIYKHMHPQARVIGPDPTYPTHAAAEAAHADQPPITYRLDPGNGWQIDLEDLEQKLLENEDIVAILLVDPGNPTGVAFRGDVLRSVVELVDKYDCFIIADEIYSELRFGTAESAHITDFLGEVPALVLRGLSKVVPWPGSRCGWIEVFNIDKDVELEKYFHELVAAKTQEVCSTTLPQLVLPEIFSNERWLRHLKNRNEAYERKADILLEVLGDVEGLTVVKPNGAYYASLVFDAGVLTDKQTLPIEATKIAAVIAPLLEDIPLDKRFSYFLLSAEGICVVPLSSGFHSRFHGFRITLLEPDEKKFRGVIKRIKQAIEAYLAS